MPLSLIRDYSMKLIEKGGPPKLAYSIAHIPAHTMPRAPYESSPRAAEGSGSGGSYLNGLGGGFDEPGGPSENIGSPLQG